MVRIFKIIEKIVWALIAIAIILVFALVAISIVSNVDNVWGNVKSYLNYLYGVAMIVVAFKAVILGVQMYLETKCAVWPRKMIGWSQFVQPCLMGQDLLIFQSSLKTDFLMSE